MAGAMTPTLHETPYGTFLFPHGEALIDYPRFYSGETYGFDIIDTGGGCTAWRREFLLPDGTPVAMVATDTSGISHALEPGEPVMLGVYDREREYEEALACWIQSEARVPPEDWNLGGAA
jgi:hypothetical protein